MSAFGVVHKSANANAQLARLVASGKAPTELKVRHTRRLLGRAGSRYIAASAASKKKSQRILDLRESGKLAERLGAS